MSTAEERVTRLGADNGVICSGTESGCVLGAEFLDPGASSGASSGEGTVLLF